MRRRWAALLALVCCYSGGCIVDFKYPLGPVKKAIVDPKLLGVWECHDANEKPSRVTFMDYDGKQYVLYLTAEGDDPTHMRAYSTPIKGRFFLNLQLVGPQRIDSSWLFFEHTFPSEGRLSLRGVNPSPFEKVREDAKKVRRMLERNLDNADFFESPFSCVKANQKNDRQ